MHKVVKQIDRLNRSIVDEFVDIPTAIISDVTSKYENTMSSGIKPVWEQPNMVGTAITVKTYPGDNLMIHKALTLAEPGDVLVIDANSYSEAGLIGELLSLSCQKHGVNGVVIDGAVRDVSEIEEMAFPVYARAVSPKGSYKSHPGSINVSISCGGVTVNPGDIIIGDGEGIAVVNPDNAQEVLSDARKKLDAEMEIKQQIEAGEYIYHLADHDESYQDLNILED